MGKFILKRVAISVVLLFFVMFLIYLLMYSLPTSYFEATARELATQPGSTKSATVWLAELNAQYGMDKGVVQGYFTWLGSVLKGEFGDSWQWTVPVTEQFRNTVWYSFALGLISFILEIAIAVPIGVAAAVKQYSVTDYAVTAIALIGISMPTFFVASLLKMIFAVKLGWFDITGMQSRNYIMMTPWQQFWDVAHHFVLPVACLVIVSIGSWMRYTRTNMLEVLNADYIRTARAKGLPERQVIGRHAFRNTLIPLVTLFGSHIPTLFAGALITETLFGIRGIGFASYYAMRAGDIPFSMFYLSFIAVLTLLGNLIADVLYAVVDPRIRVS